MSFRICFRLLHPIQFVVIVVVCSDLVIIIIIIRCDLMRAKITTDDVTLQIRTCTLNLDDIQSTSQFAC